VLRYRQALAAGREKVVAALVPERKPSDPTWVGLCEQIGIVLLWPGAFDALWATTTES
jgi:hypothetical protein